MRLTEAETRKHARRPSHSTEPQSRAVDCNWTVACDTNNSTNLLDSTKPSVHIWPIYRQLQNVRPRQQACGVFRISVRRGRGDVRSAIIIQKFTVRPRGGVGVGGGRTTGLMKTPLRQAQLSQKSRATLAPCRWKFCRVIQGHSRSFEITP